MIICPDCKKEICPEKGGAVCTYCGYLYINIKAERGEERPFFDRYRKLKEKIFQKNIPLKDSHSGELSEVSQFIFVPEMNSEIRFLKAGEYSLKKICDHADATECLVFSNVGRGREKSFEELFLRFIAEMESFVEKIYPDLKDAFKPPQYIDYTYGLGLLRLKNRNYFFEDVFSCLCNLINLLSKRIRILLVFDGADKFTDHGREILNRLIKLCPKNVRVLAVGEETLAGSSVSNEHEKWFQKYYDLNMPSEFPISCRTKFEGLNYAEFSRFEYDLIKFITRLFSDDGEKAREFVSEAARYSQQSGVGTIFIRILTKIHPSCIKSRQVYKSMIKNLYDAIDYEDISKLTIRIYYIEYLISHAYFEKNMEEANGYLLLYSMVLKNALQYPEQERLQSDSFRGGHQEAFRLELLLKQLCLNFFIAKSNWKISVFENFDETADTLLEAYKKRPGAFTAQLVLLRECLMEGLILFDEIYEDEREERGYLSSVEILSSYNEYLKKMMDYGGSLFSPLLRARANLLYAKHNLDMEKCLECFYICNQPQALKSHEYVMLMAKACDFVLGKCFSGDNPMAHKSLIDHTVESLRRAAVVLFRLFPYKSVYDGESGAFFLASLLNKRGLYYYSQDKYVSAAEWLEKSRRFMTRMESRELPAPERPNFQALYEALLTNGIVALQKSAYAEAEKLFIEMEKTIREKSGFETENSVIWYSNLYFYFKKLYERYNGREINPFYKFKDPKLSNEIVAGIRNALINSRLVLVYGHSDIAGVTFKQLKQVAEYFRDLDDDYYDNYKNICYGYLAICRENELIAKSPAAGYIERKFSEISKDDFEFFLDQDFLPFDEENARILMNHLLSNDFFE